MHKWYVRKLTSVHIKYLIPLRFVTQKGVIWDPFIESHQLFSPRGRQVPPTVTQMDIKGMLKNSFVKSKDVNAELVSFDRH